MKREIAATLLICMFAGASFAGDVRSNELPPPGDDLTSLIRKSLSEPGTEPEADAQAIGQDWQLFSSELWLDGVPETPGVSLDALANKFDRYPSYRALTQTRRELPTSFALSHGHLTANLGANVTTLDSPTTVIPVAAYAGSLSPSGGTGTLNGRLEYDTTSWQFFGGTNRSLIANADGTIGASNTLLGGTFYKLPDAWLGGKIGTGVEVNPVGNAKTRLEYRQKFGGTEGFIAAERTTPFQSVPAHDTSGVNALKAGINRKF